jgi:hypothetical protein
VWRTRYVLVPKWAKMRHLLRPSDCLGHSVCLLCNANTMHAAELSFFLRCSTIRNNCPGMRRTACFRHCVYFLYACNTMKRIPRHPRADKPCTMRGSSRTPHR